MIWLTNPDIDPEALGFIPSFLSEDDPRPAAEQFNERYMSGWHPQEGFNMDKNGTLTYPGDPPMEPLACTLFHDEELVCFYDHAYVAITQRDGSFQVSRMD